MQYNHWVHGFMDLGHNLFKQRHVAWRHQALTKPMLIYIQ